MKIRVLQVAVCKTGMYGGVPNFINQLCSRMKSDEFQIEYFFCNIQPKANESFNNLLSKSEVYEGRAFEDHHKLMSVFLLISSLWKLLGNKHYDIIHVNTGNVYILAIYMVLAKLNRIPVRIAHAHSNPPNENGLRQFIRIISQKIICNNATNLYACSLSAGIGVAGKTFKKRGLIINNAIDVKKYAFDRTIRNKVRVKERIGDKTKIYIIVAALLEVKNHCFLIDVFKEIYLTDRNSMLWIVGDGELKQNLLSLIRDRGLTASVRMMGARSNVNELLMAADAYICTSFTEGLSLSIIEAQASGLKVFMPDDLPHEHKITNSVFFIKRELSANAWANYISPRVTTTYKRNGSEISIKEKGYDINDVVFAMECGYKKALR